MVFNRMNLKRARKEERYSMQTLADAIGSSKSHIWEIESGYTEDPRLSTVCKIAKVLKKPIDYFIIFED